MRTIGRIDDTGADTGIVFGAVDRIFEFCKSIIRRIDIDLKRIACYAIGVGAGLNIGFRTLKRA